MRRNIVRTAESLLLVALVMPVGMLLATESPLQPATSSSSANWYNVDQASSLLNQMQTLSRKARREVARLQVQEIEMNWREQAARLAQARTDINTIGSDLMQLDQMKGRLEPWQQSLIYRVTPKIHEMVYQMDAAIKILDKESSPSVLALTEYPQNINMIYKNANRLAGTLGTVTHYARAEERMAALGQKTGRKNS